MVQFGQRDDDIWIVTFPKSGTTIMQMILYQLTTDGSMDFRHINDVCPWVRNAAARGLEPPDIPSPRILKSHDDYGFFSRKTKGRFIYVIRDGMDVAVSYYHQIRNYNNPSVTLDEVFQKSFIRKGKRNWFRFNRDWLKNRNGLPVLYLRYEDILNNKMNVIHQLIDFLSLAVTPDAIERTLERSGFEFMKQHEEKFGMERMENKRVYSEFIRKGKTGEGAHYLNKEQVDTFRQSYSNQLSTLIYSRFGG